MPDLVLTAQSLYDTDKRYIPDYELVIRKYLDAVGVDDAAKAEEFSSLELDALKLAQKSPVNKNGMPFYYQADDQFVRGEIYWATLAVRDNANSKANDLEQSLVRLSCSYNKNQGEIARVKKQADDWRSLAGDAGYAAGLFSAQLSKAW